MPPTTAPERTGASGQYFPVPAPPPRRMMSPAGYLGLGVAAVISAFIIVKILSSFSSGGTGPAVLDSYQQVDLGQFSRELSPEPGALIREPFMLKVVLRLNPEVRDLASLKSQVERRRDLLRHIIFSDVMDKKSDAELRKPGTVDALSAEIKDRVNRELGSSRDGQVAISQVLFSERRLPERR
jgi:flagellar basal body-associated protein FliL